MSRHRSPSNIAFMDLLLNALLGFVALFALALVQMNPITESEKRIETEGYYIVLIRWDEKLDDDVDLYVRDPLGKIVYFNHREENLMHLERDDRGIVNDVVEMPGGKIIKIQKNEERVILRGVIQGEYITNVQMFKKAGPIPIKVQGLLYKLKGRDTKLIEKEVLLKFDGDEQTLFRFALDAEGNVKDINYLPKKLIEDIRSARPSGQNQSRGPRGHGSYGPRRD